ncbi:hypothetical protein V6N13_038592 [Hibiscus sabdariffa]|uniref:S1 motif domain-containing protein n=1 Tax=Hibiscus sabdariffa TaxID=183260 RepID=A0ABR2B5F3_9ROSI
MRNSPSLSFSNRKAMIDSQAQLRIGSVVLGTVRSLKSYGAFIDIVKLTACRPPSCFSYYYGSSIWQRIAQAEAMACADMLRFQHENELTLSSDRILGPFTANLPV